MRQFVHRSCATFGLFWIGSTSFADATTNGPFGINIPSTGLTVSDVDIGQVEEFRPGDPDFDTNPSLYHSNVNPTQVFWRTPGSLSTFSASNGVNATNEVRDHATEVAGVMISTNTTLKGVAPGAHLYSIGDHGTGPDFDPATAESIQHLISLPSTDIRAVNMSNLNPPLLLNPPLKGDELLSQFIDWSASANDKDILYVVSGYQGNVSPNYIPIDNFNGMTIAYSEKVGSTWSKVGSGNNFTKDASGDRTSTSLIAPGAGYSGGTDTYHSVGR